MTVTKYVLMGVAGCGKSSVGEALNAALGWVYVDGDDLHDPSNVAKMEKGIPLTDEDRAPWLQAVGEILQKHDVPVAVGCSALKRSYRNIIRDAAQADICFIHLSGSRDLIEKRMRARTGHFMPVSLLDSQFAALEPPANETAITVDISGDLANIVEQIKTGLASLR